MKNTIAPFTGFSPKIFNFFEELSKNNNTNWFKENRETYDNYLISPAKSYITEMGNFFNLLNPAIRTEPKFNQTIMRINKDMRFAKGEPYRNYLLIHFGKFKMDSEFFVYFDANECQIGLFINASNGNEFYFKQNLSKYKNEISEVCKQYKINQNHSLYELNKAPDLVINNFNFAEHFNALAKFKMIILQKIITPNQLKIFGPEFLSESVKIFYTLYPLYCFAISDNPLSLLDKFEETFVSE
ncbi:MAG TPA: DUF2461 family protein [Melioribacteraceae bacterium]|nr:DUF2461 family protein [Melioribacteraceae bacterium]